MRHVDFDPDQLSEKADQDWWRQWLSEAEAATAALILKWRASEPISADDFQSALWKALKVWLMEHVFHGKCAYCEIHLTGARQPGDAEHYRPKGEVRFVPDGRRRSIRASAYDEKGNSVDHPGYFWLAYHWRNLLPTCTMCNRAVKRNLFPTEDHHVFVIELTDDRLGELSEEPNETPIPFEAGSNGYLLPPMALDQHEAPQLLHPYRDDPSKHLRFGEGGVVVELSPQGESSIRVYKLDDNDLARERQKAQQRAWWQYQAAFQHAEANLNMTQDECHAFGWTFLTDWKDGREPFSAAGLDYVVYVKKAPEL